ncbi:unnamed protein product [Durusdinium trenchii]|uniref:Uncharacterized protein n=1 Tax=Durusdinium trenchii TaxID=1381693 RepID=A0ABP0LA93_9DINO
MTLRAAVVVSCLSWPLWAAAKLSDSVDCSSEACEQNIQQSLLQHSTLVSKDKKHQVIADPLEGVCDTVETPPQSPYADEINNNYFYAIAFTNDTLTNPYSYKWVERYNYRLRLEGREGFEGWWMESPKPASRWTYHDFSGNSTAAEALVLRDLHEVVCTHSRHCQTLSENWCRVSLFL